jgi:hypothetical protein
MFQGLSRSPVTTPESGFLLANVVVKGSAIRDKSWGHGERA